jgi:hypothetical protein
MSRHSVRLLSEGRMLARLRIRRPSRVTILVSSLESVKPVL